MPDVTTNNVPTLQELIERSGVDPSYFGQFGATEFGSQLGLEGKQLEGFKKFANIMKFDPSKIESLLSSIGEYGKERRGTIEEQYSGGVKNLRTNLFGQMTGARQKTGGFAGSGAQETDISLLGDQAGTTFGALGGSRRSGLSGLQEQIESRGGRTQGLLGDYISRLTQLGSQFLSYDPGGSGDNTDKEDPGYSDPEEPPKEFTSIPSQYSGDMINVGGIMYKWNPTLRRYELAEGDPDTLTTDDTSPGNDNTTDPGSGGLGSVYI